METTGVGVFAVGAGASLSDLVLAESFTAFITEGVPEVCQQ